MAWKYSMDGFRFLFKERAFRQEIMLGICLIGIEFFRETPIGIRIYLISSFVLILVTECINSAIETVIDRIGLERHHLSKKAKDIGSAAVFITILHFAGIWLGSWFW
jgi:diacylglycerol kinase (ATP)